MLDLFCFVWYNEVWNKNRRLKMINEVKYLSIKKEFDEQMLSSYKKEKGIFYTNIGLASLMLKDLNLPKESVILDPSCGAGSFLYAALALGYEKVYGADLDSDAIDICQTALPEAKTINMDTLANKSTSVLEALNIPDKADLVIGNPPYKVILPADDFCPADPLFKKKVSRSGRNLFVASLYRSLNMMKPNGILSYVVPKNFLALKLYKDLRSRLLKDYSLLSIVDLGAYFPDVTGEQIILTIKNAKPTEQSLIHLRQLNNGNFETDISIKQSFYTDPILLFRTNKDVELYLKLTSAYPTLQQTFKGRMGLGEGKETRGRDIRKFGFKEPTIGPVPEKDTEIFMQNIYSLQAGIIATFGEGRSPDRSSVTILRSEDTELIEFLLAFFHSRLSNYFLVKFCFNESRYTTHTNNYILEQLPIADFKNTPAFEVLKSTISSLRKTDFMSDEWMYCLELLNSLIYNIYQISPEDIEYIENTMRKMQSQKWNWREKDV